MQNCACVLPESDYLKLQILDAMYQCGLYGFGVDDGAPQAGR
jgi:hypothetical protein